ncbi:MAG: purine-nucleoside phosphorylase [Deltaproteobacteria bacterium]|nr:purine-nucleoside phosphorylase [Deltaproteobacteria bacterium]
MINKTEIDNVVALIQNSYPIKPTIGLVLGSGLGGFANQLQDRVTFKYKSLPGFCSSGVAGHVGELVLGSINGTNCAVMNGRVHYYEGYDMQQVTFPIRVLAALGINVLIVTNAAGALKSKMHPGSLMLISDHINLTGQNPLRGPNNNELGPRFPDMSLAYPFAARKILHEIAAAQSMTLHEGVYVGVTGPTYETPAEVRMLAALGADAVGMSTVAEVIVAVHAGMQVVGISVITNHAAGIAKHQLSHSEVQAIGAQVRPNFNKLLVQAVPRLSRLWSKD